MSPADVLRTRFPDRGFAPARLAKIAEGIPQAMAAELALDAVMARECEPDGSNAEILFAAACVLHRAEV